LLDVLLLKPELLNPSAEARLEDRITVGPSDTPAGNTTRPDGSLSAF
jgi:hypothetical protein